jgi:hypothetical protein
MVFLLISCTEEERDIEKLKGIWEVVNEEEDAFSNMMGEILGPPVLEIIDETTFHLAFFGLKGLGEMKVIEEEDIIKINWQNSDLELSYSLEDGGETITMIVNNDEYVFNKRDARRNIASEPIESVPIDKNVLIGKWKLIRKKGGGKNTMDDFVRKEAGSLYDFTSEDVVEIKYGNGDFEGGNYFINDKSKLLIATDDGNKEYNCLFFTSQEMRLKDELNNAVITLIRFGSKPSLIVIEENQVKRKEETIARPKILNLYNSKFQKLRTEIVMNYDKYIKVLDSREEGNFKAFAKFKEDLKFIKESETLEEFIEKSPRITDDVVKEYFLGMELLLTPVRKGE